jgi:hypothetical protein
MAPTQKRPDHETVSAAHARAIAPGDRAAEKAFARISWGEAPAIGILGKSGTGKTEAARRLIPHYLRASGGIAIVIDDKELKPRYQGQCFVAPSSIRPGQMKPEPRVIVFRGDPAQMLGVDHEEVAAYQQRLAAQGFKTLCVHDEMSDAARYGQWKAGKDSLIARQFVKGRVIGVGKLWLTQLPQYVPEEPWSQSTSFLCFNVDEGTIQRLKRNRWVDDRLARTITSLPDGDAPPSDRGYFVLLEPDCASDGQVYRFPLQR